MKNGRNSQREPGNKSDSHILDQAREVHEKSGLPMRWAMKVAKGEMPLAEAVKSLQKRDRIQRMVDNGELEQGHAASVLSGRSTLEEGLKATRLRRRKRAEDYQKSHLQELAGSATSVTLALIGNRTVSGLVASHESFTIMLTDKDGQSVEIDKHDIKFFFFTQDRKRAVKSVQWGDPGQALEPGALSTRKERAKIKARVLLAAHEDGQMFRWATVEQDLLRGRVGWFGRFELVLQTSRDVPIFVMRHAYSAME
jgi:sRNA-binding regulator protein Hfq